MTKIFLALLLTGAASLSALAQTAHPRPLVACADINGLTRLQAHQVLVRYCRDNGFGVIQDSLSALVCSKHIDSAPNTFMAESLNTRLEPFTPELSLHFKLVTRGDGRMHIEARAWRSVSGRDDRDKLPEPVADVQRMLSQSQRDWYRKHPEMAPGHSA